MTSPTASSKSDARNIHDEPRNVAWPIEENPRGGDGQREITFFRDIALPLGAQVVAIIFEVYLLEKLFHNNNS